MMGDIIRPGSVPMRLAADIIGTAPIERVDVLHGTRVVETIRPYLASGIGRRVRILWQGAENRGRGRETFWRGKLAVANNSIVRHAPVNFLNPERKVEEAVAGRVLTWTSVTTGNLVGIDLWLEEAGRGILTIDTNVVSGKVDLAALLDEPVVLEGGGLGRRVSVYRLPDHDWARSVSLEHMVSFSGGADMRVLLRVTQADGHQAWTSPIYLIA
jgi:hypothetical protein